MTTCKLKFTPGGARRFFVDGVEVDEWSYHKGCAKEAAEQRRVLVPQRGRRFRTPGLFGDTGDWRGERDAKTGKDGRYCPQLARRPGDPNAVCRNRTELIERGKRRGWTVDQD